MLTVRTKRLSRKTSYTEMKDSKVVDFFYTLLSFSLNGRNSAPTELLTEREWGELYKIAAEQSSIALLTSGIESLESKLRPPTALIRQWIVAAEMIRCRNEVMNKASFKIQNELSEKGIRSCLLKGQGTAAYYPSPHKRMSGDIDLWIDCDRKSFIPLIKEQFPKCCIKYKDVGILTPNGIEVEFHFTPAVLYSCFHNTRLQKFFRKNKEEQFLNKTYIGAENLPVCAPTCAFNRIYLLVHMFSHYLYEGIGLRQFVDYYFLLKKGFTGEEKAQYVKTISALGLSKFAAAVMYVLTRCFGMKENLLPVIPDANEGKLLLKEIMQGGNFGIYNVNNKNIKPYSVSAFFQHTARNARYIKSYPSEVISTPIFKLWHYCYRKSNGYI